jgi:tetratricopeptide (TPR) repeat protein
MSRQAVIRQLRYELAKNGISFNEIVLPKGMEPAKLVQDLLWRLDTLPPGVVSIEGFQGAFPEEPELLARALYALNFNREKIAAYPHRQIWWMPSHFAENFVRLVPDLDSWFLTRVFLFEEPIKNSAISFQPPSFSIKEPIPTEAAKRQAGELMERFAQGIKNGLPLRNLIHNNALSAITLLHRSGLVKQAADLEKRIVDQFGPDVFNLNQYDESPADFNQLVIQGGKLLEAARYAEAESVFRRAIDIAGKIYGPERLEYAVALNGLATLFEETNRLAEAEPLMRRTLEISEKHYGPDHPNVATNLNNVAHVLLLTNRLTEAEQLLRRALTIGEKNFGTEHPEVSPFLNNLAALLESANRLAEAEPLMRRALAIAEKGYGPEHPEITAVLNNLGNLLRNTNRHKEAEVFLHRALKIGEKSFGPEHPNVATTLNNLAGLLQETDRKAEAEPLMRRALAIVEKSYGPEHPDVATDMCNLAVLLQDTGRIAEAEPMMRHALQIAEKSYGPEHPKLGTFLNNLAGLLQDTNRFDEAERLFRRALSIAEKSSGPEHPDVAIILNNLAHLLQDTDRLAAAEPLMARHLVIFMKFFRDTGHQHPHLRAAVNNYVNILKAMKLSETEIKKKLEELKAQAEQ